MKPAGEQIPSHFFPVFILLKQKKYDAAEKLISAGLTEATEKGDAANMALHHSVFGILCKLKKDYRQAFRYYEKAEKLLPQDPSLKLITARLLLDYFGQYDIVLRKTDKVLEIAPTDFPFVHQAHTLQGLAYLKKGDKQKAASSFAKSMENGFKGLHAATNLDFALLEAMMKRKVDVALCKEFLQKALAFTQKTREPRFEKFVRRLIQLFPKSS